MSKTVYFKFTDGCNEYRDNNFDRPVVLSSVSKDDLKEVATYQDVLAYARHLNAFVELVRG